MKYSFKEHEKNFIEWCRQGYNVPLSEAQKPKVKDFLKNIDDPNFTMESILSYIAESPNFQGLTWDSFIEQLSSLSKKGQQGDKEITVQSWRKFKRLIKTSITNNIL